MPTSLNEKREPENGGYRLTGRHVLFILLGAFAFVFAVNGVMIWKALDSFPGVVTQSSYRDSQRFNRSIAEAQAQASRGWRVDAKAERVTDGRVVVRLEAHDAAGAPISGVAFKAMLLHPANRAHDHVVPLQKVAGADGAFEGAATGVTEGKWGLEILGENDAGLVFRSENSLFLR
ncbi:MAG: FixH family protein [Siculibacillus sp.]|nr:FixH family protein [Siculibacillus sp.]